MEQVKVEFSNADALGAWLADQVKTALADDDVEARAKRIDNVTRVVGLAKAHWEGGASNAPIQVEMWEAYVGTGGKKIPNLTAMQDQGKTEQAAKADDKPAEDKPAEAAKADDPPPPKADEPVYVWPQDMNKSNVDDQW